MLCELKQIDSADISVVIQGPLYRHLGPHCGIEPCIKSVRKHLPNAEIVVSTWQHEDVTGVTADKIVVSPDPGCQLDCTGNQININRMVQSTSAGIKAASRLYVMKFRSDHNLTGTALARIGSIAQGTPEHVRLFHRPITVTTLFIRDPARYPMLFHISDLVQFGAREDMLTLWDLPLFSSEEVLRPRPTRNPFGNFIGYTDLRKVPEQLLMIGAMQKQGFDIDLEHPSALRFRDLILWEQVLRYNFHMVEWRQADVEIPQRLVSVRYALNTVYRTIEFQKLSQLSPLQQKLRMVRVLLNKYVLNCFRPAWWMALTNLTLFSLSPPLAKRLRTLWRRCRKLTNPDSGRI